jgi:GT2 family glycosyltransferase
MWFSKGDNPFFDSNGRHNIAHNYNKARRFVLDNGYDYLFTVEADMVIPPDALDKLLAVCEGGADVAYGLYCFRNTSTWSAWTILTMEYGRSIRKDPEQAKAAWGKVIDVAGVGTGCTLIKREVLEQIEFRTDEMHPDVHHDWVFAYDLQQKGFVQRCDLSVVCGHISMTPFPRILWPDPDAPRMYRNDFLEKIKTLPDGSLVMEIGALGDYDMNQSDLQPAQA